MNGSESASKSLFSKRGEQLHGRVNAKMSRIMEKLLGVLNTGRSMHDYHQALFGDMSFEEMEAKLNGQVTVDIGSGITHLAQDSLINHIASQGDPNTLFIGLDPAAREIKGMKFFNLLSRLTAWSHVRTNKKDLPGNSFAIAGKFPGTLFPERSVNIFLANFSLGVWITKPKDVLENLDAVYTFMADDGELRVANGLPEWFNQNDELHQYVEHHFIVDHVSEFLTIFKKKQI